MWLTVKEVERELGAQIRQTRLERDMTVDQTAERAGVSAKTVHNLEVGNGSSLSTLVKVLRALEAEDWLTTLAEPAPEVSPMAMLEGRDDAQRQRASGVRRG